jgi:valyl-tRNA synthetase
MQWFLSMQHFADIALPPVMNDEIKFYPTKYTGDLPQLAENIKDRCISRQLWWRHRIPACICRRVYLSWPKRRKRHWSWHARRAATSI